MQIPLQPANATTIHSEQGQTGHNGVVLYPSEGKPFTRGLEYIGTSRATKIENLILASPLTADHYG